MRKVVLVMAGGRGERFWPKSKKKIPKQFLALSGNKKTMLQLTVGRIFPIAEIEDIYISTNEEYRMLVREQLPEIPDENIICEPVGRNTAPSIGLAAVYIQKRLGEALMIILPADQLIKYESLFVNVLEEACQVALEGLNLVTVGIQPNYPETGYGYIKYKRSKLCGQAFLVEKFVEKPAAETAEQYLRSGEYLWNSGMFIWKISSILEKIKIYLPDIYKSLMSIKNAIATKEEAEVLKREYFEFPSISIDYGIMEKSDDIYILPGMFGWDDVGSWLALERIGRKDKNGNVVSGNVINVNSENCIIEGGSRLIAAVGLKDLIVVDSENAILICRKKAVNDIKKVMEELRDKGGDEYI